VAQRKCGYVFTINGYVAILFKNISLKPSNRIITELHKLLLTKIGKDVVIILGPTVYSSDSIYISCDQALKLINMKFIYGHKRIIYNYNERLDDENNIDTNTKIDENELILNLCNAIDADSHNYINNITEDILTYYLVCDENENIIKSRYAHMYLMVVNRILRDNESIRNSINSKDVIDEIYRKDSLQELHGYFKYNIILISEMLSKLRPDNLIDKILDYINRNYNSDIKLESIAEIFNYNSAYLGKLFKNSTGMPFNTYLDTVRVNMAKDMLKEGMKVYQVSEKTGYKDIAYFYKKFKKYAGVSPSIYKEKT
jgi:two-component system response regulator YesN